MKLPKSSTHQREEIKNKNLIKKKKKEIFSKIPSECNRPVYMHVCIGLRVCRREREMFEGHSRKLKESKLGLNVNFKSTVCWLRELPKQTIGYV